MLLVFNHWENDWVLVSKTRRSLDPGPNCPVAAGYINSRPQAVLAGAHAISKEVDSNEITVRFWQEIYGNQDELVEIHEKYPVDKGHRKL